MKEFDLNRLKVASVYIGRMADGRNPASNQPVEDEILNNPNVIRCLHFVREVLEEVSANHGIVGKQYVRKKEPFPVEVLRQFAYRRDKPISHVLKQMEEPVEGRDFRRLNASGVNKQLGAQGYIEKRVLEESGRECWFPTDRGEAEGMYIQKNGDPGREYVTIMYNEKGQRFLVSFVERMLSETPEDPAQE